MIFFFFLPSTFCYLILLVVLWDQRINRYYQTSDIKELSSFFCVQGVPCSASKSLVKEKLAIKLDYNWIFRCEIQILKFWWQRKLPIVIEVWCEIQIFNFWWQRKLPIVVEESESSVSWTRSSQSVVGWEIKTWKDASMKDEDLKEMDQWAANTIQ